MATENNATGLKMKRFENGEIDIDGTVNEFRSTLEQFAKQEKQEGTKISQALDRVLKRHNGVNFHLPTLADFTVRELTDDPEEAMVLGEKVKNFIRNHQEKFQITRGRSAGVKVLTPLKKTG